MHMGEKEREAEEEKGCTHAVWRVVGERKSLRTREREGEGEKECTHVVQRVVGKRKSLRTWEREGEGEKEKERTHAVGRERESSLAPLFMFFSCPWACPMQIGLSQECCSTSL